MNMFHQRELPIVVSLRDEPTSGIGRGSTRCLHSGDNMYSLGPKSGTELQCSLVKDDLNIAHM